VTKLLKLKHRAITMLSGQSWRKKGSGARRGRGWVCGKQGEDRNNAGEKQEGQRCSGISYLYWLIGNVTMEKRLAEPRVKKGIQMGHRATGPDAPEEGAVLRKWPHIIMRVESGFVRRVMKEKCDRHAKKKKGEGNGLIREEFVLYDNGKNG